MSRKRLSPLPEIPRNADPALRRWLTAAKESLEVRLGRRGDPMEAAVTFNDMVDAGLVQGSGRLNASTGLPELIPVYPPGGGPGSGGIIPEYPVPPKPENVIALGVFGGIHVLWDEAADRPDITLVEVRRSADADFENSSTIGSSSGNSYFDIITQAAEVTYYYWVRFKSFDGDVGPWSEVASATKAAEVDYILDEISGHISEQDFVQALNDRIDLIDGDAQMDGSVNARIADEATLREDGDSALAQDITTVQTNLNDEIASVEQTLSAEISTLDGEVTNIGAQYTLALDVSGYVSGYTTYNDGTTSSIVFRVDDFAIGSPGNPDYFPFYFDVDDNTAYLDTVMIKDASIQEAKIGSVTFGKVTEADGTPVTTAGGLLRVDMIDVDNLNVTTAMIEDAAITEAKISNAAVTTAKIGDAAVDTLQLAGQAVTIPSSSYSNGQINMGGSWVNLISTSMVSSGAPIFIFTSAVMVSGDPDFSIDLQIVAGGTVVVDAPSSITPNTVEWQSASRRYTAGVGSISVILRGRKSENWSGTAAAFRRAMLLLETKR